MSTLLFYGNPVPLNSARHRDLKIAPARDGYSFATKTNSIPLMGVEFREAAKEYPVVFAKAGEAFLSVALVGLRNDENLLVDGEGKWDARYVPAFARRYPFVLAQDGAEGNLTVCIDETFSGFNREQGEALFDDAGEQSPRLKEIVAFLNDFHGQALRTERLIKRLQELELLMELTAKVRLPAGQELTLAGLHVVDEAKLAKLDDAVALEMFRSGELGLIYSHLASLSNLQSLVERLGKRSA